MPHVTDYIQWRGDIPFENDPLNEVDNLIFCFPMSSWMAQSHPPRTDV